MDPEQRLGTKLEWDPRFPYVFVDPIDSKMLSNLRQRAGKSVALSIIRHHHLPAPAWIPEALPCLKIGGGWSDKGFSVNRA